MAHAPSDRRTQRVALASLAGGTIIFAAKLVAWRLTGSSAVLADAAESTVNVAAALFAIFAVRFAAQPADRDHPYGHGKIEFLAAAFEGGLITFAAITIFVTAIQQLIVGPELRRLDVGLLVTAAAGAGNLLLGNHVLRRGRALQSPTLIADGKHILSDVWTTAGVLAGLLLVRLTGIVWLDPIAALIVGLLLARTGVSLVRESIDALLDREDPTLLARLVDTINEVEIEGIGRVHRLRAIRSGNVVHVDAHVFVPANWSVLRAHDAVVQLETTIKERCNVKGEVVFHLDPCHGGECGTCALPACGRHASGGRRRKLTVEEAVSPVGSAPHPQRSQES